MVQVDIKMTEGQFSRLETQCLLIRRWLNSSRHTQDGRGESYTTDLLGDVSLKVVRDPEEE